MSEPARRLATWNNLAAMPDDGRVGARWMRLGAWTDGDTPRVAPFEAIALDVAGFFLPLSE